MSDPRVLLLRAGHRVVAFNPLFAKITGCVKAGLFLSQAFYWQGVVGPDVPFYKTSVEWEKETCLTKREQVTAREKLKSLGVLKEFVTNAPTGPSTLFFELDLFVLSDKLGDWDGSRVPETPFKECGNVTLKSAETSLFYKEEESTTESTTYIKPSPLTKAEEKEPTRFTIFKAVVFRFYQWKWGRAPLWDGAEANQLSRLLKADPSLDVQTFSVWLKNYGSSQDISPGERPCMFIPRITKYSVAALNQFGREENVGNESKQDAIARRNREAFAQVRGGLPQPM